MLPKPNRLPGHLIPRVLNSPVNLHSPFFGLKVFSSSHSAPRIAFIVSSKIAPRAVDRNRLKRLLRQSLYPRLKLLKPQHDLVFLAKRPLKNQTLKTLQPQIKSVLQQAKLLNEKSSS